VRKSASVWRRAPEIGGVLQLCEITRDFFENIAVAVRVTPSRSSFDPLPLRSGSGNVAELARLGRPLCRLRAPPGGAASPGGAMRGRTARRGASAPWCASASSRAAPDRGVDRTRRRRGDRRFSVSSRQLHGEIRRIEPWESVRRTAGFRDETSNRRSPRRRRVRSTPRSGAARELASRCACRAFSGLRGERRCSVS